MWDVKCMWWTKAKQAKAWSKVNIFVVLEMRKQIHGGSLMIFSANFKLRKSGRGARSGGIKSKWLPLGGSSPHERRRASFQNSVSRDRNSPLIFDSRWSPCWWSTWWWTRCLSSACCHRPDEDGGHAGPNGDLQICSELSVHLPIVPTVSNKSSSKIFFWSILIYISDLLKSFTIHNSFTAVLFRVC